MVFTLVRTSAHRRSPCAHCLASGRASRKACACSRRCSVIGHIHPRCRVEQPFNLTTKRSKTLPGPVLARNRVCTRASGGSQVSCIARTAERWRRQPARRTAARPCASAQGARGCAGLQDCIGLQRTGRPAPQTRGTWRRTPAAARAGSHARPRARPSPAPSAPAPPRRPRPARRRRRRRRSAHAVPVLLRRALTAFVIHRSMNRRALRIAILDQCRIQRRP